ncbi:ERAD-associated E3 ubiquitin-protein ligase component HRD3A [Selaginella moellendorffii]|nr:ERAD-associated E3 ubiquitin-protein ligase component HRD3A [Selaginella moellendorffii]|eukprot:XP_002989053.2 ERAD-associated E3 ubiquitin-protein ligase component HRD3A [Selaginella moellendorffii]
MLDGSVPPEPEESFSDWDFPDLDGTEIEEPDPGSWRLVMEEVEHGRNDSYGAAVAQLINSVNDGELELIQTAVKELQGLADQGHAHAQSTLASLYGHGYGMEQSDLKSFLFHHFAAEGGNYQSKMALAYSYYRQQLFEEAAHLYAELAAAAVASFVSAKEGPLIEHVRLNYGPEESKDSLKKFRGEEDDDFQFLEYQAQKGNSAAMHKIGVIYYYGLRGIPRDHIRALSWFTKSVEKGDSASLEFLGEIYARGFGVERNYTKAYDYFKKAIREKRFSAYNGIGYLYFIGQGVDKKNMTKAKEFYKRAADHNDPNGFYNLGVIYLKGAGVKKSIKMASRYLILAANTGHPKAYYQLAKMQQRGLGMKKDLPTAVDLYKAVAERGPWGALLRWGLESYLKGEIALSLLLYSRAAELGYEVAQSNAAWILDKFHEEAVCIGKNGYCTVEERHHRAHTLWRFASEQGNEYAALLIGDAYYYGRGTVKDLDRAAEAYMRARLQFNAQAMYNIGYMHEHGLGLPKDFHLAKRYYDLALDADQSAFLPIYLALGVLWLRQRNEESMLVKAIDMLPELSKQFTTWARDFTTAFSIEEGNATLLTLVVCLVTVLYLRSLRRQQRQQEDAVYGEQE